MTRRSKSGKKSLRVSEVLTDRGSSFGSLLQQASLLMQVQSLLQGLLGPGFNDGFQVAAIRQNELVLITPSAARATQLRLQGPQMLRSLQQAGLPNIDSIAVRVAPLAEQPEEQRSTRPLSPAAEQAFRLMGRLTADEDE